MNINVEKAKSTYVEDLDFELVERKGVGHPDTLCDAIAERASRRYSQYCLENFGGIAHHWFDKVMLLGGEADVTPGVGRMLRPYQLVFAGKGAYRMGEHSIPMQEIFHAAAAEVLGSCLTGFDANRHLVIDNRIVDHHGSGRLNSRYRPQTAAELVRLDDRERVSNDCNLLSGFAPFTRLERLVLEAERYVNGAEFKAQHADTGWDVKVFGTRREDRFDLLVNVPFLAAHVGDVATYFRRKAVIQADIYDRLKQLVGVEFNLSLNATDKNGRPYLTALGSVADTGDVGVVGRGNRINGLITPMRPMSIEAPAGKNPIDHTGKIYGLMAHNLAQDIAIEVGKPVELHVFVSKETPLTTPDEVHVSLTGMDVTAPHAALVRQRIEHELATIHDYTRRFVFDGPELW